MSLNSILVVDDDDTFRERLIKALVGRGFATTGASSISEAIEKFNENAFNGVILDLNIKREDGLNFLEYIKQNEPATKVVILTGYGSIATALRATKLGADNYLLKPTELEDILKAFENFEASSEPFRTQSLAEAEWEHIQMILNECNGNITHTAEKLKIPRRTLQRKLDKYVK